MPERFPVQLQHTLLLLPSLYLPYKGGDFFRFAFDDDFHGFTPFLAFTSLSCYNQRRTEVKYMDEPDLNDIQLPEIPSVPVPQKILYDLRKEEERAKKKRGDL